MAFEIETFVYGWKLLILVLVLMLILFIYIELGGRFKTETKDPGKKIIVIRDVMNFIIFLVPILWLIDFILDGTITETNLLFTFWIPFSIFFIVFMHIFYWTYRFTQMKEPIKMPWKDRLK